MHLYPPEDNMDFAENPRGPGVTRAPLWVSPDTPAYFLAKDLGALCPHFGLPNSASQLKGISFP